MIVVINPSGAAGHSFKGLHAYCAHDATSPTTSERVDWMETRNLATDDPHQGWKIMAATAQAQDALKAAAGVKATGRKSARHVMHIVLSFHDQEAPTREEMAAAADELLSKLGVDPAQQRGKARASRAQFAHEHQAIYYAHNDTDSRHLHIMLNRVHGRHGTLLPSSNDQLKASKWAEAFSQRYGTQHATPDRQINNAARENGEYVKGQRRTKKRQFELERAAKASNDNDIVEGVRLQQNRKDAALALKGRNMRALQAREWDALNSSHVERREAIKRQAARDVAKARASVRDALRPQWRDLNARQDREKAAFEQMEASLFGRARNVIASLKQARAQAQDDPRGSLARAFRVLVSETERRRVFARAQAAERAALKREETQKAETATQHEKTRAAQKLEANRQHYFEERRQVRARHRVQEAAYGAEWKTRKLERMAALREAQAKAAEAARLLETHRKAVKPDTSDPRLAWFQSRLSAQDEFRAASKPETEQDRDKDWEHDRDD